MRICFVVPTLARGGMERVVSLLASYSVDKGYDVYIVCLIKKEMAYHLSDKVHVLAPPFAYKKGWVGKIKATRYLIAVLKKLKPDAFISFSEVFNPLSILAALVARVPVYISDRSSPDKVLSTFVQLLRRMTYPFAKGIVAQTEYSKRVSIQRKYNKNIVVIGNPLLHFEGVPPKKENIIISVGRLIPTKNFSELIDIFSELGGNEGWHLWIIGEGPERCRLEEKIKRLSLDERVKLIGAVDNVEYYLSHASVFAYTSLSEGFPNALSEALAYPLPCIAYDCPAGPSEMIFDGENGFLIPLCDKESFKYRLDQLMRSPALREQLVGQYVQHRDRFSTNRISDCYLRFVLNKVDV